MAGLAFNDTTTKNGLIQECEFLLNLGDATITGDASSAALLKTFTRLINQNLHKVITMIFASMDEWDWDDASNTKYPIASRNLIANQPDYLFSSALWALLGEEGASDGSNAAISPLKVKRIEVSYDGTTWNRANPFDINESLDATDTTTIRNNFTTVNPFYDIDNNGLRLFPTPPAAVTKGLRIWFSRAATEFVSTDTTKTPPIDIAFHRMLAIGACLDYAIARDQSKKIPVLGELWVDYERRLKEYYGSKEADRRLTFGSIYSDDYGS